MKTTLGQKKIRKNSKLPIGTQKCSIREPGMGVKTKRGWGRDVKRE